MSNKIDLITHLNAISVEDESARCIQTLISSQDQWIFDGDVLCHKKRGFFQLIGLRSDQTSEEKLMLYQPQSALTGLIFSRIDQKPVVLLQIRFEPGNPNFYQYGPTIQSTAANYLRVHGGKATPYYEYFSGYSAGILPLYTTTQYDLEHRYYQKTKVLSYLWAKEAFEPEPNFVWVSVEELSQLMSESESFNPDLRSLLILFDWSQIPGRSSSAVTFSSDYGLAFQPISQFVNWSIFPIQSLKRWNVTDEGIIDSEFEGLNVRMYDIYCQSRENPHWIQPLMEASSDGLVQLGIRNHGSETEYLLTHQHCMGVGPQGVMLPSFWRYPGQAEQYGSPLTGTVIHEFTQSDEGGRFIRHANRYQVIEIDQDLALQPGQSWGTESQLHNLLCTSNLVGFSLRIVLSALLKDWVVGSG